MAGGGETSVIGSVEDPESEQLHRATVWSPGRVPEEWDPANSLHPGGIYWFDIARQAESETLLALLEPFCKGLAQQMLDDLLTPDEIPESRSWHDGTVRLASSFAVYAPEARARGGFDPVFAPSADAIYEAVELLAGEDWLITHWHDARHYRGADRIEGNLPPVSRQPLMNAVAKRWIACGGGNAGDLGVLAMHELALTYALTHRRFHAALERWELDLYGAADSDSEMTDDYEGRLRDLWGAHARLRDWLNR